MGGWVSLNIYIHVYFSFSFCLVVPKCFVCWGGFNIFLGWGQHFLFFFFHFLFCSQDFFSFSYYIALHSIALHPSTLNCTNAHGTEMQSRAVHCNSHRCTALQAIITCGRASECNFSIKLGLANMRKYYFAPTNHCNWFVQQNGTSWLKFKCSGPFTGRPRLLKVDLASQREARLFTGRPASKREAGPLTGRLGLSKKAMRITERPGLSEKGRTSPREAGPLKGGPGL